MHGEYIYHFNNASQEGKKYLHPVDKWNVGENTIK